MAYPDCGCQAPGWELEPTNSAVCQDVSSCSGYCWFGIDAETGLWKFTSSTCSTGCDCQTPSFCPPAGFTCAKTRTNCVSTGIAVAPNDTTTVNYCICVEGPDYQTCLDNCQHAPIDNDGFFTNKPCTGGLSTTSSTTTTTTTTTLPSDCSGGCVWKYIQGVGSVLDTVSSTCIDTSCPCVQPDDTDPAIYGYPCVTFTTPCDSSPEAVYAAFLSQTSATPCTTSMCTGVGCNYVWDGTNWNLDASGSPCLELCPERAIGPCSCDEPTVPGEYCGAQMFTPCYTHTIPSSSYFEPSGASPTTSYTTTTTQPRPTTTTTTVSGQCVGKCIWQSVSNVWTIQTSCPGCNCVNPPYDPTSDCDFVETRCIAGLTSSTTSTTTTTTTTTAPSCTGTCDWDCSGAYCVQLSSACVGVSCYCLYPGTAFEPTVPFTWPCGNGGVPTTSSTTTTTTVTIPTTATSSTTTTTTTTAPSYTYWSCVCCPQTPDESGGTEFYKYCIGSNEEDFAPEGCRLIQNGYANEGDCLSFCAADVPGGCYGDADCTSGNSCSGASTSSTTSTTTTTATTPPPSGWWCVTIEYPLSGKTCADPGRFRVTNCTTDPDNLGAPGTYCDKIIHGDDSMYMDCLSCWLAHQTSDGGSGT